MGRPDMGSDDGGAMTAADEDDDGLVRLLFAFAFAFEFILIGEASSKSPLSCMPARDIAKPSR